MAVSVLFPTSLLAAGECGVATDGGSLSCDESSFTDLGDDGDIVYMGYDGLYIESSGLNISTGPLDRKTGILLGTRAQPIGARPMFTEDLHLKWNSGTITTGDPNVIGHEQTVTPGKWSDGIRLENRGEGGARIDFLDGQITTHGYNAMGLYAWQRDMIVGNYSPVILRFSGQDSVVTTHGSRSHGIYARTETGHGDTLVDARDGTINLFGPKSVGIYANKLKSSIIDSAGNILVTVDNIGISSEGTDSMAISATNNGTRGDTVVSGSVRGIATLGARAHGIYTRIADVETDAAGVGRISNGTAEIALTGGPIETSGQAAHGLFALGIGGQSRVSLSFGASLDTSGQGSNGISAVAQDAVSVTVHGTIRGGRAQTGELHPGLSANGAGIHAAALIPSFPDTQPVNPDPVHFAPNTRPVDIQIGSGATVGALSDHAIMVDGGTATITNSGTTTGYVTTWNGNDTFTNNSPNSWNIRDFRTTTDPRVRDTEHVAISDFGGGSDTVLNNTTGTIRLLTVEDMTAFTADTTDDTAPAFWDTTVAEYFPDLRAPDQPSAMHPITMTGVEQAHLLNLETFENRGLITMADAATGGVRPVAGDVLVITGHSVADGTDGGGRFVSKGGRLHLDTVLDDGVIDTTDVLVIDRATLAGGATGISVFNALPGRGASTDINRNEKFDPDEGILVVQALAPGSTKGTFALVSPVVDGAWQYYLDQTDGQSWYLHSRLSAATATYEAYPQTLLALSDVPTMRRRVGDRYWRDAGDCSATRDGSNMTIEGCAIWVRIDATHAHVKPQQSKARAEFDQSRWSLQAGVDTILHESAAGGRLFGGLTVHYGTASSDIASEFGGGTIDTTAGGIGGTLTWIATNGFYVDTQGVMTWFDSDLSSDMLGTLRKDNSGFGYALSVEVGQRFDWRGDWTLTPQAQISHARVDFDDFRAPHGERVSAPPTRSTKLRLGLAAERDVTRTSAGGKRQRSRTYAAANIVHDFAGQSVVDVSGKKLRSRRQAWTAETALGFERRMDNDRMSVYGEINLATGLENPGKDIRAGASLGLRIKF